MSGTVVDPVLPEAPPAAPPVGDGAVGGSHRPRRGRRAHRPGRPPFGLTATGLAVAGVFVAPTAYLVVRAVGLGGALGRGLTGPSVAAALVRTVVLAVAVSVAATLVGTTLAWLLARTDVPGRRAWRVLAPLPLVVPSFVGAAALRAGLAPGGLVAESAALVGVTRTPSFDGFVGAWLVLTLFTYPYVYLPVAARFAALPPNLEESARMLGRGPWSTFRTVVLPQSTPALGAGSLLVFLYTISDFGAVSIMRYSTLTREIFQSKLVPATWVPASLVLAALALVVVASERWAAGRRAPVAVHGGQRARLVPLGRWRAPAAAAVAAVIAVALVGPLAVLGLWAVRGAWHSGRTTGTTAVDPGSLVGAGFTTVSLGLTAAAVAVALVLPVAYLTARYRSPGGSTANAVVVAGFALPGVVVALALVFWVLNLAPFRVLYQTMPLLVAAYVIHFGAQAMRASQVAVAAVPRRLDEAARMLGASRRRRLVTVELPLMAPGLLAGGGLVMLSTMKELPATLVLAPPGVHTLATRIWNANESYLLAQVGLASLVLVGVSGVLTWLLVIRRADVFD